MGVCDLEIVKNQMTIHYHGTPITPRKVLQTLAGKFFCVSYAAPGDVAYCHEIGQGVMLDNGAFSVWRRGIAPNWVGYYEWAEKWLDYHTTWAVIPDVIDGDEDDNDELLTVWPHRDRGAPVWHMHESIDRLMWLCDEYPRVCIGSSGEYATVGDSRWHHRMTEAMNRICRSGSSPAWLHMLRGMAASQWGYPFASVDSTDIARNHHCLRVPARQKADEWESIQCPGKWEIKPLQTKINFEEEKIC